MDPKAIDTLKRETLKPAVCYAFTGSAAAASR